MASWFTGLWRHPNFIKLWVGQTISSFGSQITSIALPLTAALTLQATPVQMGILGALRYAPFSLAGLFAGVWVDRVRRRPLLIGAATIGSLLGGLLGEQIGLGPTMIVGVSGGLLAFLWLLWSPLPTLTWPQAAKEERMPT